MRRNIPGRVSGFSKRGGATLTGHRRFGRGDGYVGHLSSRLRQGRSNRILDTRHPQDSEDDPQALILRRPVCR
jgi:hypothetical protein